MRSRLDSVLKGQGAFSEDVEIVFGGGEQRFDFNADLIFRGAHTTGTTVAKGVLRDRARTIFKGMIRIGREAKNANAYLAEHAMILDPEARADSIPGLEIETNEVKATHSASVAQVDEEQIFYLMSRGFTREEARRAIVLAYLEPAVTRVSSLAIRRRIRYLLEQKWGRRPIDYRRTREFRPEVLVEIEEEPTAAKDLFEQHYKYR
jgi:Fe-S cluster assembly scaffold protein SufB